MRKLKIGTKQVVTVTLQFPVLALSSDQLLAHLSQLIFWVHCLWTKNVTSPPKPLTKLVICSQWLDENAPLHPTHRHQRPRDTCAATQTPKWQIQYRIMLLPIKVRSATIKRHRPAADNRLFVSVQRQMKMEFPSQTTNSSYPFRPLPSQGGTGNRPKMSLPASPRNTEIVNDRAR